jgi:cytochrome P450
MTAVIRESMRLYTPVVNHPARRVSKNTTLGDWKIPKGTLVIAAIYPNHNSDSSFKDSKEFNPERFLKKEAKLANWFPFSAGPRVCMGMTFSVLEQQVFLSLIVQNFKFSLVNKDEKIQIDGSKGILSPKPNDIKFTKIN